MTSPSAAPSSQFQIIFVDRLPARRFAEQLLLLVGTVPDHAPGPHGNTLPLTSAPSDDAEPETGACFEGGVDFWLPSDTAGARRLAQKIGPFRLEASGERSVCIIGPIHALEPSSLVWHQRVNPLGAHEAGLDVLALPVVATGLSWSALHSLAGLAQATGGFESAAWTGDPSLVWSAKPSSNSRALRSMGNRSVWTALTVADARVEDVFFSGIAASSTRTAPSKAWRGELETLVEKFPSSIAAIQTHLDSILRLGFPWRIEIASEPPAAERFLTPPPPNAAEPDATAALVGWLLPDAESGSVGVYLSAELPAAEHAATLLHLCSHLALGHVLPEDTTGHWDTRSSIKAPKRQWDRDAAAFVLTRLTPRAESLDDCTDTEKASLILLDLIRRQLGQSNALHPATEDYYAAEYQRAAAQRLVHQLDLYGGGMLCDGVGLGKTYVATTVLIHYVNKWLERFPAGGERDIDPFRVSILAPNSVVATWLNEAIAPLEKFGVPAKWVRVIAHSKLSRIAGTSELLTQRSNGCCDMEHLLLSDLVVVDEAHNFRALGAKRTLVLRDTLRNRHRFPPEDQRRVLLLTATPVNNSLDDLRQQASLMLSTALNLANDNTESGYRDAAIREVQRRINAAREMKDTTDRSALLAYGANDAKPEAVKLRDDLDFGPRARRIQEYLIAEGNRLEDKQNEMRDAMLNNQPVKQDGAKIASEFLDRIVVQRSRHLCKEMEQTSNPNAALLFRPDAGRPQQLKFEDVLDAQRDVLADFLPLFQGSEEGANEVQHPPLSLKIYMWSEVRDGLRDSDETTPVVGLQRVLVLKRLESSPVSFLITMLRLLALHARRITELATLCEKLGDAERMKTLNAEVKAVFDEIDDAKEDKLDILLTDAIVRSENLELLRRWAKAHTESKPAAASDDLENPQMDLFAQPRADEVDATPLERIWNLREALLQDLKTLLLRTPALVDIVFPNFDSNDLPKNFLLGGDEVEWPQTAMWGRRIVSDGKLRTLFKKLLSATRNDERVIVFSQFTDSVSYVASVLRALDDLDADDWQEVLEKLRSDGEPELTEGDLFALRKAVGVVRGETDDRESIVDRFAPFYRISPFYLSRPEEMLAPALVGVSAWEQRWLDAMKNPIKVLFASDVLAEGVNLQDASLLINFDVHWNPVRMIQRAGRIDRRLNAAIENANGFPDLEEVATRTGQRVPAYWWHGNRHRTPVIANMLPPDELEKQLLLRERIATKTMTIDFTLGLEQGTGAEADWMQNYRYEGVNALNAWQGDRAIERLSGYAQRIEKDLKARGVRSEWLEGVNGWFCEGEAHGAHRILAWARLSNRANPANIVTEYARYLTPLFSEGVPYWLSTSTLATQWDRNYWLKIDGEKVPAEFRRDLPVWSDAARPIQTEDLLSVAERICNGETLFRDLGPEAGRPFQQGAAAVAAGVYDEADRRNIIIKGFRILEIQPALQSIHVITPSEP